jgi:hypothetical protein
MTSKIRIIFVRIELIVELTTLHVQYNSKMNIHAF